MAMFQSIIKRSSVAMIERFRVHFSFTNQEYNRLEISLCRSHMQKGNVFIAWLREVESVDERENESVDIVVFGRDHELDQLICI